MERWRRPLLALPGAVAVVEAEPALEGVAALEEERTAEEGVAAERFAPEDGALTDDEGVPAGAIGRFFGATIACSFDATREDFLVAMLGVGAAAKLPRLERFTIRRFNEAAFVCAVRPLKPL
mmetsp:Transcript_483/g.1451  ORF Transcript_483/g.1451 Transcript_483/m.1451 type:complete len:122 (-) Transcript_483:344-709(-)